MKYLVRKRGKKRRIHLLKTRPKDTHCKQLSTGGIKRLNRFEELDDIPMDGALCKMCVVNFEKVQRDTLALPPGSSVEVNRQV